jgi:two-component system OmpR family sensor kinase
MRSLRARLTLWYVGVLAFALITMATGSYFVAERILTRRLDASLLDTLREVKQSLAEQAKTPQPDGQLASRALDSLRHPNRTIWIFGSDGKVLVTKNAITGPVLRHPEVRTGVGNQPHYFDLDETRSDTEDSCRGIFQRVTVHADGGQFFVAVAQADEVISDQLDILQDLALFVVPFSLLLAGSGGWFLARQSLAPVGDMAVAARQITVKNVSDRLPQKNQDDEIGSLATEFNQLLDRLETAFTQQRQFMADASHELRTPLSVLRTAAEVTLGKESRDEPDYREALVIVKQQSGRLSHIVDGMFALARADMGQQITHSTDFYLDEIVDEAVLAASVLAARKEQKIEAKCADECLYRGDEGLIRQMVLALLDNAVKYTPQGGSIKVSLENRGTYYVVFITDTGPGIPVGDHPRIFDRFFRSDKARTSNPNGNGGAGLGLSIARSIAELHKGQIELKRSDTTGTTFIILLPFGETRYS